MDLFIKEGRVQASLNHLTPMEINSVRPVFPDTLNALMTLHEVSYICIFMFLTIKNVVQLLNRFVQFNHTLRHNLMGVVDVPRFQIALKYLFIIITKICF